MYRYNAPTIDSPSVSRNEADQNSVIIIILKEHASKTASKIRVQRLVF